MVKRDPQCLNSNGLDSRVRELGLWRKYFQREPSRSTLYHHRNTLVRLGAVTYDKGRLVATGDDSRVSGLIRQAPSQTGQCTEKVATLFGDLVVTNRDCMEAFFRHFWLHEVPPEGEAAFRRLADPAIWKWTHENGRRVILTGKHGTNVDLASQSAIKGVLYGIRYWARDQLGLVDEIALHDGRVLMFPVLTGAGKLAPESLARRIVSNIAVGAEWTLVSVRDLALRYCVERRQPRSALREAIDFLLEAWPGKVVLVPTSRAFATMTASSSQAKELELRGYYRDSEGRVISHIRLHSSIRR